MNIRKAQGLRPTQSFLEAIYQINSSFSDYWINRLEDEASTNSEHWEEKFPDGIEISDIFEQTLATKYATLLQQSSFAVFKGQDSSKLTPSASSSLKNSPSNSSKKPLCPCGWKHFFSECYYINKVARPSNFKPSAVKQQKVDFFLSDPINKSRVEAALQKAEKFQQRRNIKPQQDSTLQLIYKRQLLFLRYRFHIQGQLCRSIL